MTTPPSRLPSFERDGFELDSGEEMNRLHPETFEIPPLEKRTAVRPGRIVKLIFRIATRDADGVDSEASERMWVVVVGRVGDFYLGELDNQPRSRPDLESGTRVAFKAEHIIDFWGGRP